MNEQDMLLVLAAKALGTERAIATLSAEERRERPSRKLGSDYNRLRTRVSGEFPEFKELLPPAITLPEAFPGQGDGPPIQATYAELMAYHAQIREMLLVAAGRTSPQLAGL